ncbi:hypothetical protein [Amycolatopsis sp. NBC_00438]|uniref:hypothetical protein n=1 Tax=Amycolatopsis sp. NBC_00438 TaxID=2903558 RepID=UPI002E246AC2
MKITVFRTATFRPKLLGHQLELLVLPLHGFVGNVESPGDLQTKYVAFDQVAARTLYMARRSEACPYTGMVTDDGTPWRYVGEEFRQSSDSDGWPSDPDYHASVYVCALCGAKAESILRSTAFHPTPRVFQNDIVTVSSGLGFDVNRGVLTSSDDPGMLTLTVGGTRLGASYAQKYFAGLRLIYSGTGDFASEGACPPVPLMVLV